MLVSQIRTLLFAPRLTLILAEILRKSRPEGEKKERMKKEKNERKEIHTAGGPMAVRTCTDHLPSVAQTTLLWFWSYPTQTKNTH